MGNFKKGFAPHFSPIVDKIGAENILSILYLTGSNSKPLRVSVKHEMDFWWFK